MKSKITKIIMTIVALLCFTLLLEVINLVNSKAPSSYYFIETFDDVQLKNYISGKHKYPANFIDDKMKYYTDIVGSASSLEDAYKLLENERDMGSDSVRLVYEDEIYYGFYIGISPKTNELTENGEKVLIYKSSACDSNGRYFIMDDYKLLQAINMELYIDTYNNASAQILSTDIRSSLNKYIVTIYMTETVYGDFGLHDETTIYKQVIEINKGTRVATTLETYQVGNVILDYNYKGDQYNFNYKDDPDISNLSIDSNKKEINSNSVEEELLNYTDIQIQSITNSYDYYPEDFIDNTVQACSIIKSESVNTQSEALRLVSGSSSTGNTEYAFTMRKDGANYNNLVFNKKYYDIVENKMYADNISTIKKILNLLNVPATYHMAPTKVYNSTIVENSDEYIYTVFKLTLNDNRDKVDVIKQVTHVQKETRDVITDKEEIIRTVEFKKEN